MLHFLLASVAAIKILTADGAISQYETGNQLLETCTSNKTFDRGICLGYLQGVADNLTVSRFMNKTKSCINPNVTGKQLMGVALKYFGQHPETRHLPAAFLLTMAYGEAWKCE